MSSIARAVNSFLFYAFFLPGPERARAGAGGVPVSLQTCEKHDGCRSPTTVPPPPFYHKQIAGLVRQENVNFDPLVCSVEHCS